MNKNSTLIRESVWEGERVDYLLFYHANSIKQKNLKVFLSGSLSFTRAKGKGFVSFCCVLSILKSLERRVTLMQLILKSHYYY